MIIFHYLDITFLLNIGSSTAYCGKQNMEDMDIDQIVDVPDTPDRLTTRHVGRKYVGNPDVFVNEKRERGFPVAENGKDRRLGFCPPKNFNGGEMNNCSSHIAVSPSKKSYAPQNAPIFRRTQTDKYFSHDSIHTNGSEKMEKGKAICTKFPSKSMSCGGVTVFDLTEGNGQPQKLKPVFSHHGSKDSASEYKKELKVSVGNSPIPCIHDSSNTSSITFAGKCKIDDTILPCSNKSVDRGKSIDLSSDSQQKTEKQTSLPPRFLSAPRVSGQKRLVRNGCISPLNIAARAKQATENSSQRTSDVEQSHAGDAISIGTGSSVSINDIVAEERGSSRVKGKELLTHSSSSSAHDAGTINKVSSSPVIDYEEANDTNNVIRNSIKCSGGPGGWRTTRNHRINGHSLHDVTGHRLRRNNDAENFISTQYRNRVDRKDTGSSQSSKEVRYPLEDHAADATSLIIPEADQSTAPCPPADKLTKRQRKNGSTSSNPNSEIMFLDLLGESSNPSSSRTSVLDTEVVELSPETRYTNRVSHDLDDMPNDDSDALARQVEADEILARELQEQLYHEDSFDRVEIDEHLAWELQHEEELLHTSIDSHRTSNPRWLSRAPSNRQPRSRPQQSPTNRRRAVPHVPPSNRVSQLRNRIISRSPTPNISTRGRRLRFPVDMDFDMRLDILEALEDAVGDLSDMGVADDIFQAHRDFNENDYEMLLALDENNHQHAGASANQINSLPQSTVQTDNFEEACAICLETPVIGDTIRHLPCLHKFHKDCIDPWLHRRTSCPVCKSSIT